MAGITLNVEVNDATSFLEEFGDILHVYGFVRWKPALCRSLGL